jgi:farnesyl diphosphate synthase
VSDGIIDQVTINHGKLSWHHVHGVGSNALNDALLLEGAVYQLAREHFRQEPYYVDLLELLHETRHPAYFRNPVPVSTSKLRFMFLHKLMPDCPCVFLTRGKHIYQFPIDQ